MTAKARPRSTAARSGSRGQAAPWIGWTALTRDDLVQAQQLLEPELRGMRDPLGLNALHTLYADRFFPGTSTQMTRLRYVLLVAAAYESLRHRDVSIDLELPRLEQITALQLLAGLREGDNPRGIIGRTIVRARPPQVLPSMSYWTALAHWGLLATDPATGRRPSRSVAHTRWDLYRRRHAGLHAEFEEGRPLFAAALEERWRDGVREASLRNVGDPRQPLTLEIQPWERDLLLQHLTSPIGAGSSFLGALAAHANAAKPWKAPAPWHGPIRRYAPEADRKTLADAERLAHLGLAARAVYDVLVARLAREQDGIEIDTTPEARLEQVTALGSAELQLALAAPLPGDDPSGPQPDIPASLGRFLRRLREWLHVRSNPEDLRPLFASRELELKKDGRRTRLHRALGREQRGEWHKLYDEAQPLNYRWPIVQQLLADLVGERQ